MAAGAGPPPRALPAAGRGIVRLPRDGVGRVLLVRRDLDPRARDHLYPRAILLDYGASPRNPPGAVERRLRDYVVQPDPANPNLLLGKAYFAFGNCRLASNFFIIGRLGPAEWKP